MISGLDNTIQSRALNSHGLTIRGGDSLLGATIRSQTLDEYGNTNKSGSNFSNSKF